MRGVLLLVLLVGLGKARRQARRLVLHRMRMQQLLPHPPTVTAGQRASASAVFDEWICILHTWFAEFLVDRLHLTSLPYLVLISHKEVLWNCGTSSKSRKCCS